MPGLRLQNSFSLGLKPVLKVACGQDEKGTSDFAKNWGWEETANDWKKVVERPDIDIIDICTPTYLHKDIVIAAAKNGKQIFCEKPIALNFAEAKEMYEAAEKAGVLHYLNHNYRRTPAIAFAKQLIEEGQDRTDLPLARNLPAGLDHRSEFPPDLAPAEEIRGSRSAL